MRQSFNLYLLVAQITFGQTSDIIVTKRRSGWKHSQRQMSQQVEQQNVAPECVLSGPAFVLSTCGAFSLEHNFKHPTFQLTLF